MKQKRYITKAVFPVAGFGLRFLPITKAIPKEMLPIIDTPLIQLKCTLCDEKKRQQHP